MMLLFVGLAIVACLLLLIEHISPEAQPSPWLVTVGRTTERGKPAVVFQVRDHAKRRIQITGVRQVIENREPAFLEPTDFAAPGWPCGDPSKAWREFAVFAPTNTSLWHLEVRIVFDQGNLIRRLRDFPSSWHTLRFGMGMSQIKAAWFALGAFYSDASDQLWIEGQVITNDVPRV